MKIDSFKVRLIWIDSPSSGGIDGAAKGETKQKSTNSPVKDNVLLIAESEMELCTPLQSFANRFVLMPWLLKELKLPALSVVRKREMEQSSYPEDSP